MRRNEGHLMEQGLFSIAVLSYQNFCYLFEALNSIFEQDYPRVELVIANDGATDFDEAKLSDHLARHCPPSVERVTIRNSRENIGTVGSAEWCRLHTHGEYFMLLAADDALYDAGVFSRFVEAFEQGGETLLAVCAGVVMCGRTLWERVSRIPSAEEIELLREEDPEKLFGRLCYSAMIPTTGTCLRRNLFERIGGYDTRYVIIEDATFFIRMARKGIVFRWVDFDAALHRDGGVSHSEKKNSSEPYRKYRLDEIRMYEQEIRPYLSHLSASDRRMANRKAYIVEWLYKKTFLYRSCNRTLAVRMQLEQELQRVKGKQEYRAGKPGFLVRAVCYNILFLCHEVGRMVYSVLKKRR